MSWRTDWKSWFVLGAMLVGSSSSSYAQTWHGGGELLFTKPTVSGEVPIMVQRDNGATIENFSLGGERDYDPAFRVWLSRVAESGWTLRGRFWHFDHEASETYTVQPNEEAIIGLFGIFEGVAGIASDPGDVALWQERLKAYTGDLELGQILEPSMGRFHVGGGVRAAGLFTQTSAQVNGQPMSFSETERIGVGPTVFVEYERAIFQPISIFASTRSAILMSESTERNVSLDDDYSLMLDTETINWQQETRFGLNFLKSFESHDLVASTFLEHQYWDGGQSFLDTNVGFFGVGIQIGFVR